jgi:Ni,Fe-hydrogenase III large subunit
MNPFQLLNSVWMVWKKQKKAIQTVKVKEIPEGMGTGRAEAPRGEVFHIWCFPTDPTTPVRHKKGLPAM